MTTTRRLRFQAAAVSSCGSGEASFTASEGVGQAEIDEITYSCALHACVVANLVEEGKTLFSSIRRPEVRHYALMVLLLARARLFNEVKIFIDKNQLGRHVDVVRALLDGCKIHRNVRRGKNVIEHLCDIKPLNADNYVLLSNWYASYSLKHMVDELRETIRDMNLLPKRASSWIEFRNKIHAFGIADVSHPRSIKLYWVLESLVKKMEEEGHVFDSDFSFHDVAEERECIITGHSEMLALSFGLISSKETTIRVTKNLRVCRSCHDIAKFTSSFVLFILVSTSFI